MSTLLNHLLLPHDSHCPVSTCMHASPRSPDQRMTLFEHWHPRTEPHSPAVTMTSRMPALFETELGVWTGQHVVCQELQIREWVGQGRPSTATMVCSTRIMGTQCISGKA